MYVARMTATVAHLKDTFIMECPRGSSVIGGGGGGRSIILVNLNYHLHLHIIIMHDIVLLVIFLEWNSADCFLLLYY